VNVGRPARTAARFVALGCALALQGAPAQSDAARSNVRLLLASAPQSRYAGYYLALDRGIYRRAGVDVEIVSSGRGDDRLRWLREGKADVALFDLTEALRAQNDGVALVCVGQIVGRSTVAIVAWKDRGITRLGDLDRRRLCSRDRFLPAVSALMAANHLQPVFVPQYDTLNLFLQRGVDACTVTNYDEYHQLNQAGIDDGQLSCFALADAGIDLPEDGLYALRQDRTRLAAAAPAVASASLEGWQYAADHPDEALGAVMRRVREQRVLTNEAHMRWMLARIVPSILPGAAAGPQRGALSRQSFTVACDWLVRLGLLRQAPAYEDFVW